MTHLINMKIMAMLLAGLVATPVAIMAADSPVPSQATPTPSLTVKGRVVDDAGEPLPGATIMVKGTSIGTGTDIDGNFSLELKTRQKVTLAISYVGMERREIQATPGDDLYIALSPNGNMLDELIVSGYQTISRERATGSAIVLGSEKLDKIQAPDLSAKLEGIAPGLTVYNNSMSIRGASSFAVDATPLLVIDGQPATGLTMDDINPNIIEGVTVLKDAAATSLYGVRAANGVIVITTKRGRDSKLDINASLGYYINPLPSLDYQHYASTGDIIDLEREFLLTDPDYMNNPSGYFSTMTGKSSAKYMSGVDMLYYNLANGNIDEAQLNASLAALRLNDYRRQYRERMQHTALTQDYNLSINKGGDSYGFYAAARYQKVGQYNKFDSDDRFSLYLKNDLQIAKWMSLTLGADLAFNKTSYSMASGLGATAAMPYDLLYNPDGTPAYRYLYNEVLAQTVNETEGLNFMGYNAAQESALNKLKTDNLYMKYFIQTNFDITRDLGLEVKFQYEKRKLDASEYDEADSYMMRSMVNEFASTDARGNLVYNIPQGGRLYTMDTDYDYYNLRAQFDYKKTFGGRHDVTALIGGELRQDLTKSHAGERYGYDDQKLTYNQVDWKTLSQEGVVGALYSASRRKSENLTVTEVKHRYVSAYLNAGYIFDSRYSLNASVRVEQADLFGSDPKYRYRPLWSVGASWNVSNESFMKDITWLDMLKLRCTYGITGNVDQSSSPYLLAAYSTSFYSGAPISMIVSPPNSSLRWEQTSTFNFGIDFRLFNRLSGSIDAYRKYSSDLLVNKSIDPSLGFDGMARANNGEMKNTGFELNLSYEFVRTRDIIFNASFSTAYNNNKIMKVDYDPTDALDMMRDPTSNYRAGDTYNSLYAYRYAGLTDTGNPSVYDENGNIVSVTSVRNVGAVICAGQLTPKWNGALNLDFRWRDLSVYAKIVYYAGHTLRRDVPTLYDASNPIDGGAINELIVDRWTPDNTDTDIPAMGLHGDTGESNYHWIYADYNTCSASFAKLRNIGVAYSFPTRLLSKTRVIKGATLRFQIDNLCRVTSNKYGIDPEAFNANLGTRTDAQMPTYIIGLNINL
ncbi:MAG: SusC/RagA family TonB-linked outer membrane protein [Pseudoflavonifractor sp.]|nr:SusC/RagA family TonB-linked outer membrane protein [Pseudoflavonifractor sp.]